jgi:uncharacterized hydantoinase/oxoprolinase family protein
MAEFLAERQMEQILAALENVQKRADRPPGTLILSGAGEFLARRISGRIPIEPGGQVLSLSEMLSPELAQCACAYAVASLAAADRSPLRVD